MEIDQITESENTANVPDESTENLVDDSTEIESEASETEGESQPEETGYEPNFSFKVLDDEKEFDERLRGVIKDKETEDYVRELYTKAHGLDTYKTKLESQKSEFENVQAKYHETESQLEQIKQGINQLENLSKEDFMAFQRRLDIPDEKILDRAREILNMRDRPAHEQQRYEQSVKDRMEYQRSQAEIDRVNRENQALQQRQHQFEMNQAMSQPEIQEFQKAFDTRLGEGAFERHVAQYGSVQFQQGRYVMPTEAVMSVYKQYKPLIEVSQPASSKPPSDSSSEPQPPKPMKNLGSGVNQTVTTKPFRSLEQIRKAAESMPFGT